MPINNLNQRKMNLGQCGNIRKGIKVPVLDENGKPKKSKGKIITRPQEVNYFVFKPDEAMTDLVKQIHELYGEEPKTFTAYLASNDPDRAWDYWFEAYNYSGLIARSDGAIVTQLFDTETNQKIIMHGTVIEMPSKEGTACFDLIQGNNLQLGDMLAYYEGMIVSRTQSGDEISFDAQGRLGVVLSKLRRRLYWVVHTGGLYGDVPHITQQVNDIVEMSNNIQRITQMNVPISMIPFRLTRVEVERKYVEDGKRKSRRGWDILMEVDPEFFSGYLDMFAKTPLALSLTQPQLPEMPEDYIDSGEQPYIADDIVEEQDQQPEPTERKSPTPFDELKKQATEEAEHRQELKAEGKVSSTDFLLLADMIDEGIFESEYAAKAVMQRCAWKEQKPEKFKAWARVYRDWKTHFLGEDMKSKEATDNAIMQANAGKKVGEN